MVSCRRTITRWPSNTPPDLARTYSHSSEAGLTVRAYVEPVAVGDGLPDMPLFLEPGAHVSVPLETTSQNALAVLPHRWRAVLEAGR